MTLLVVDFTIEVERSLKVLDGAVAVFDGVAGLSHNLKVWRQADKYKVKFVSSINLIELVLISSDVLI